MSYNDSAVYQKNGAVFANAEEAYADKNSLYGPELSAEVDACYATMLANGILLEPVSYVWDPVAFTLTVKKIVLSREAYSAAVTFDPQACRSLSGQAGWTLLPIAT